MGCCSSSSPIIDRPLLWGGRRIRTSGEKFFDLQSGRMIENPENEKKIYTTSSGTFRVCGNLESITNFEIENGMSHEERSEIGHFSISGISTIAQIIRVVDADTFDLKFRVRSEDLLPMKGLNRFISEEPFEFTSIWRCRLNSVDAYEKNTELGRNAIIFVTNLFSKEKSVNIFTYNTDKYGRVLVDIFINSKSLAEILIEKGFGYKYDGGTKIISTF